MIKKLLLALVVLLCLAGQSFAVTPQVEPTIISPSQGSTLKNGWTYFSWAPSRNSSIYEWECYGLYVGTKNPNPASLAYDADIARFFIPIPDAPTLSDGRIYALVTGIPLTGNPIYVRLYYLQDGLGPKYTDFEFNTIRAPEIIIPEPVMVLDKNEVKNGKLIEFGSPTKLGTKVQFCWRPNCVTNIANWVLTVDRCQLNPPGRGQSYLHNYYDSGTKYGVLATNSLIADGLPTSFLKAYPNQYLVATLRYKNPQDLKWKKVSYLYKPGRRQYMVRPVPGARLPYNSNINLRWDNDGQSLMNTYVSVGYSPGGTEILKEKRVWTRTSTSFYLPKIKRDIYVRTKSWNKGVWVRSGLSWKYIIPGWEYTDTLYKTRRPYFSDHPIK